MGLQPHLLASGGEVAGFDDLRPQGSSIDRRHYDLYMPCIPPGALILLAAAVSAVETAEAPSRPPWAMQALITTEHAADADLTRHGGSIGVDAMTYEARLFWNPARGTQLGLGLGGGFWDYDGSRFDDEPTLRAHRLRLGGLQMLSPTWGVILQEAVGVAYDGRLPASDGITTTTFAGPVWRRDADLFIAAGVFFTTARAYNRAIPMLSVWWRIDESWTLELFDQIDNLSRITWRMDERFSAGLRLDVQQIQFAIEQADGSTGGFRDTHATIGLECDWRPLGSEALTIRPHVGWAVMRELAFTDADGDELLNDEAEAAATFGLTLKAAF